jgi:glycosyltransferase involved in cell wall biosynthesis
MEVPVRKDLRILILSEYWFPDGSGAELATWLYARAWANAGADVTVLTNGRSNQTVQKESEKYRISRLPLFNVNNRLPTYWAQFGSIPLGKTIEKEIALHDIIYVPGHWYWPIIQAKKQKKIVVCHLHDYSILCPSDGTLLNMPSMEICNGCGYIKGGRCITSSDLPRGISWSDRAIHLVASIGAWRRYISIFPKYVDYFIFVSNSQKKLYEKVAPEVAHKGTVIYNPLPKTPETEIKELGFAYLGGGYIVKGYQNILLALSIYKPPYPFYMTKCKASERQFLEKLGVRAFSKLPPMELAKLMQKVHCIVMPSLWEEPLPYNMIDAMQSGKLVIASKIGVVNELGGNSPGVFKIMRGSPEELAQAFEQVSSLDLPQARELGRSNRNRIQEIYDSFDPPTKMLSIFRSLLAR